MIVADGIGLLTHCPFHCLAVGGGEKGSLSFGTDRNG